MRKPTTFILLFLIAAAAAAMVWIGAKGLGPEEPVPSPPPAADGQKRSATETVAEGLEVPWDLVFISKDKALVTERPGRVRLLEGGKLRNEPVLTLDNAAQGEGGLQGMAVGPDFGKDRFVYLYVSEGTGDDLTNRVVRYRWSDGGRLDSPRVLLDDIPGNVNHNGGRLRFGPDKKLYVATGDGQDPDSAQDRDSLAGKILRMDPDGSAADGNPFGNLVWSYGHRNPQGLAWDGEGRLYETEHGPSGEFGLCCRDELNRIERGGNYGWPIVTGNEKRFGLGPPLLTSGASGTWAPASLAIKDGKLYFGALRGRHLHEVTLRDGRVANDRELFAGTFGRIRTVVVGPDGMLYLLTSNRDGRGKPAAGDDRIVRINRIP